MSRTLPSCASRVVVLIVMALLLTSCGKERPWNVLLITFDTTRADRLGSYGNERIQTPALDALAAEGIRFTNAMSVAPITAPSHSSILTGLYPMAHGFRDNGLFVLEERNRTLAEMLHEHGYATAAAVGAFPVVSRFGFDQGFELFDDHLTGKYEDYLGKRAVPKEQLFFDERRAAQVNEAVFPWLEERGSRPFFLWVHYFDPHQPFEPPPPYDQLYADDLYNGEIAYTDSRLGHLLENLRRMGELDRTLIVMTADHGEGLGEHNELTHAILAYDSTLHVPLIMRPPGLGPSDARVVEDRVGIVDIVPTVLDLLGLEIPDELHGHSLRSTWSNEADRNDDSNLYTPRYYAENLSPRLNHGWGELRVLYEGDKKYIHGPRPELYDLSVDPDELHNLVRDEADEAERMREALAQFMQEHAADRSIATRELDPELVRRLQSLGYLQGGASGGMEVREELQSGGIAPQDRVTDLNRLSAAKHLLFDGRSAEALSYTSKLIATGGESPLYRELHAAALAGVGRVDEAWEIARALQSTGLVSEPLVLNLTVRRFEGGDHDSAVAFLEGYAERRESAKSFWLLSDLYKRMQQPENALAALEQALSLEPDFVPARVDFAVHFAREGLQERAESEFRQALTQGPYDPRAFYNYAAFLFESGRLEDAERFFSRALELSPQYLKAHFALIVLHDTSGNRKRAQEGLRVLRQIAPGSLEFDQARELLARP